MKTRNIELMTAEIDQHRAADLLVQGIYYYGATGQGCFIGCLAHDNDTAMIAERFGVPEPLTRLLEAIFERLPFDKAAEFFSAIPRAIGRDGKDLTRVHWAFLADMLRHLPDTEARDVVAEVAAGMDLLAAGQDWPEAAEAAKAAKAAGAAYWATEAAKARAAYWAAEAAYWAAEAAKAGVEARAAYWVAEAAAEAAYWVAEAAAEARAKETRRQRDVLLRLIQEA